MNGSNRNKVLTATNCLIVLNVTVYILDKYLLDWQGGMFGEPGIVERILGFCGGDLYLTFCYYDGCLAAGEIWRSVSFLFVHLFVLHLAVNMIGLYITGNNIERKYGAVFIMTIFVAIGVLNVVATHALPFLDTTDSVTGGASGAVFGFMGIAAAHYFFDRETRNEYTKKQKWILSIYGVVFTYLMGNWTMFCHNIGFLMGFALGTAMVMIQKIQMKVER